MDGPLTPGAAAAGAAAAAAGAEAAAAAGAEGLALAPGAALPGFGTPPAAGAAGASPLGTAAGGGGGAGLAPSEHPLNPLTATAKAEVATAHHRHRMCIEQDPPEGRFDGSSAMYG